jgi:hypothetical protein
MRWPHGYRVVRRKAPVMLAGPDAQEVTVSVYAAGAQPSPAGIAAGEELASDIERSTRLLQSAGESFGELVAPVARAVLPDGSVLVSCASQWRGFSTSYLLQFTVLSLGGDMAYLTVEGRGHAAAGEYQRVLPLFKSVRWERRHEIGA